jgi:hypothetical protein
MECPCVHALVTTLALILLYHSYTCFR